MRYIPASLLTAAFAVPASAQVAGPSAPGLPGVKTMPPVRPAAPVAVAPPASTTPPSSGSYKIANQYGECVGANMAVNWPVVPFARRASCDVVFPFTLVPKASGQLLLRYGGGDLCATHARGVVANIPRVDLLPCDGQADQLFRLLPGDAPGRFRIVSVNGSCWTLAGDPFGNLSQDYVLSSACTAAALPRGDVRMIMFTLLPDAPVAQPAKP